MYQKQGAKDGGLHHHRKMFTKYNSNVFCSELSAGCHHHHTTVRRIGGYDDGGIQAHFYRSVHGTLHLASVFEDPGAPPITCAAFPLIDCHLHTNKIAKCARKVSALVTDERLIWPDFAKV